MLIRSPLGLQFANLIGMQESHVRFVNMMAFVGFLTLVVLWSQAWDNAYIAL